MNRINIDDYYMNIAVQVSLRSTCIRRRVGSVIVKNNVILATGYNGAPSGLPNCIDHCNRCYRSAHNIPSGEKLDMCYAVHSEQNAIMSALRTGQDLQGSKIYVTTFPCSTCAKLIIQSGIKEVYYINGYFDVFTREMLREAGIAVTPIEGEKFQVPKGESETTENDLDSIDPIVKAIYKYQPGTEKFIENRQKVMEENGLFERYNEEILYTEKKFDKEMTPIKNVDDLLNLHCKKANRNTLEYNGDSKKQLVVGVLVYDKNTDCYIVLKCKGERLQGKLTLVQGHVSTEGIPTVFYVYTKYPNMALIRRNTFKELLEETAIREDAIGKMEFKYIISSNDNKISSEHVGILSVITVDTSYIAKGKHYKQRIEKILNSRLKPEEANKHTIKLIPRSDLKDYVNEMDTWLKKFVLELM